MPMRAGDYLGRRAYDADGRLLGWIQDLLVTGPPDEYPVVTHVLICRRRTRLFGYEREEINGPWVIEQLARWIQGPVRQLPLSDIQLSPEAK
jgi:hypothetical protein